MNSRRSKRSRKKLNQRGGMYEYPFESVGGQFNVPIRVAGMVPDGMGSNIVGNVGDMMLTQAKIGGRRRRVNTKRDSRKQRNTKRNSRKQRKYRGGECSGCGGKLNIQLGGDGYNAAGFEGAIGNRPEIVRYDWNYQVAPNRFDATAIVPSLTGGSRRRRRNTKKRSQNKRRNTKRNSLKQRGGSKRRNTKKRNSRKNKQNKKRRNTKRGGSLASDHVMSAVNRAF